MTAFLLHLNPLFLYPALFIGIITVGGLMLMTAMYMAFNGTISLLGLFLTTILAAVITDTIWYYVGLRAKRETIYEHRFIKSKAKLAKRFAHYFDNHGGLIVFIAKFVYGARLASHILAGVHRVYYPKFVFAVVSGTTVWFGIFYSLVYIFNQTVGSTKNTALHIQLFMLGAAVFLILFNLISGAIVNRKLLKRE